MKCPHLMTFIFSLCRIERRFYAPSVFDLHEYCTNEDYIRCPLYRRKEQRTGKVGGTDET